MLTLFFFNAQSVLKSQENLKKLDIELTKLAKEELFQGQVLIAEAGKVKFSKSYGVNEDGSSILINTPIDIQSVAKAITAISILKLHETGELNVNDYLVQHIPSLGFYDGVTIKHILTHTSGLPRFFEVVFSHWPHHQFLKMEDLINLVVKHQPNLQAAPGQYESYNQTAYMLLAEVVERVTEQPFTQYVRENIFEPAGMTQTHFLVENQDYISELGEANLDNLFSLIVGDGGIESTAEDMFLLDKAINNGTLMAPNVMNLAYIPLDLAEGREGRFGFGGSLVEKEMGKRVFQHIGQGPASNAVFTRYIDTHDVLIVVHKESVQYASKVYQAIESIWKNKPYELPRKRRFHVLTPQQIAQYIGDYGDNGFMHITTEGGKLYIQPDGNPSKVLIVPSSDTTFYFEDQDVKWEIYLNDAGKVIGFGPQGEPDHMMKRWNKN